MAPRLSGPRLNYGPVWRRPLRTAAAVLALGGTGILLAAGQGTQALFSSTAANSGNSFGSAPDLTAPTASASVIGKTTGYATGYIKQGGTYYVYANVSDAGSPASGTAAVTANVSTFDSGQTGVALTAGSYSAGGASFNYRSASLTANNPQTAGTYSYTLTLTDVAGNSRTQTGFSVVVDNTAPAASNIQTANGGSTTGRAETSDTITFTFSEPMEPQSILSGWNGSATSATVRLLDGGVLCLGNDSLEIWNSANSAKLPFGTVGLGRCDYVGGALGGDATFSSSTMSMSGSTVTVTLGSGSGPVTTAGGNGTMNWPPSSTPTDRAGNNSSTTSVNESGSADKEF